MHKCEERCLSESFFSPEFALTFSFPFLSEITSAYVHFNRGKHTRKVKFIILGNYLPGIKDGEKTLLQ